MPEKNKGRGCNMTALLYILNVLGSAGQSVLGKQYAKNGGQASNFNLCKALSGAVFFLLWGLIGGFAFHWFTIILGALYGIFLFLSMYTGFRALATGPMALSGMIASFSLVVPLLFGLAVWGERLSGWGITGICLLLASLFLLNFQREGSTSVKWAVYAFATLAANGVCSVIQKYHQRQYPGRYQTEFMLASFAVTLLFLTVQKAITRRSFCISTSGLFAGMLNGMSQYIVLLLAATVNASVLFPVISVTNIMAVWLAGRMLFAEKLKPVQILGLTAGVLSVLLLNIK